MTLTSLSIMLTVFILQLHHAGPSQRRRVPTWIRQLFVSHIAPALGLRHQTAGQCRPIQTVVDQAVLLSTWPCRRTRTSNSVDPEVGTASAGGGYIPLAVRSVRESAVDRTSSQPTKRTDRDDLITRHIKLYLDRHRAEQEFEDIISEWRLMALIFDRLMFWIFSVGTALSTIFILIILPLTKSDR